MIEESHRGADRSPCVRSHQDSAADEVLSRRSPPARARRRLWRFMASSPKVTPQKDKVPEKGGSETPPDSPLLGLSDAAVKKLIRTAKKRGYVTHDQIDSLSKEVNSKQIEDVLAMFSEMGVNVVETEEASEEGEEQREEPDESFSALRRCRLFGPRISARPTQAEF